MNCSIFSWLWCGNTTFNAPKQEGTVSIWKAYLYGIWGISAIYLNSLALVALPRCGLKFPTLVLMRCHCFMNIAGLLPKTIVNPIVCYTGKPFPPPEWGLLLYYLPGGVLVLAIYSQFALQALMAINRQIAFCWHHRYKKIFTHRRTIIYCCIGMFHGVWNLGMCMFPCCLCYFNPYTHSWGYAHWGSQARKTLTVVSDAITTPTILYCYGKAFYAVKSMGGDIQSEELSNREMKREMRLLSQFATIASTWLAYSLIYRPISLLGITGEGIIFGSELIRFWMFSVDPIVYLIFLKKLRKQMLLAMFCRGSSTNRVINASVGEGIKQSQDRISRVILRIGTKKSIKVIPLECVEASKNDAPGSSNKAVQTNRVEYVDQKFATPLNLNVF